jgi:NAD(P)-dependent dehydrogenase (short-subunit alcohol dehydrogenase family)
LHRLLVVTYRRQSEFEALQVAADPLASRLEGYSINVNNGAAVRQMISSVVAKDGRLDAKTNTVGGYAAGWKTVGSRADGFRPDILNLYSSYGLLRSVVPAMLKQGQGAIVNVASRAAIDHASAAAAYAESKAATVAMVDSLAADLKGTGVRANSILPSIIDTEMNRKAMPDADFA